MNNKKRKDIGRFTIWSFGTSKSKYSRFGSVARKISIFTLAEVTLSIAVISVGMMGVIALFPVGFQATKDAMGDNYSSEMADQFLHLLKMQCVKYNGDGSYVVPVMTVPGGDMDGDGIQDFDGWGEWITGDRDDIIPFEISPGNWVNRKVYNDNFIPQLPSSRPPAANLERDQVETADQAKARYVSPIPFQNYAMFFGDGDSDGWDDTGIYFDTKRVDTTSSPPTMMLNSDGVFYVEARAGDMVDWNGVMCVWQEELLVDIDGNGKADNTETMNNSYGVRLCVEISWPFDKPYEQRRKRVYALDIFNSIERKLPRP